MADMAKGSRKHLSTTSRNNGILRNPSLHLRLTQTLVPAKDLKKGKKNKKAEHVEMVIRDAEARIGEHMIGFPAINTED